MHSLHKIAPMVADIRNGVPVVSMS